MVDFLDKHAVLQPLSETKIVGVKVLRTRYKIRPTQTDFAPAHDYLITTYLTHMCDCNFRVIDQMKQPCSSLFA